MKNDISTKILPEASTWHFCKFWSHIKELNKKHKKLKNSFKSQIFFIKSGIDSNKYKNEKRNSSKNF